MIHAKKREEHLLCEIGNVTRNVKLSHFFIYYPRRYFKPFLRRPDSMGLT